jgi:hypothetical protein
MRVPPFFNIPKNSMEDVSFYITPPSMLMTWAVM